MTYLEINWRFIKLSQTGGAVKHICSPPGPGADRCDLRYKTDFSNDSLLNNKCIQEHHFVSRSGDIAIIEDLG